MFALFLRQFRETETKQKCLPVTYQQVVGFSWLGECLSTCYCTFLYTVLLMSEKHTKNEVIGMIIQSNTFFCRFLFLYH